MASNGRWAKGQSGNPRGQRSPAAVALASLIGEATDNGAELVAMLLSIARGRDNGFKDEKSRRWALGVLLERLAGRPLQAIDLEVQAPPRPQPNYSVLTDEEAEQYERITGKLMKTLEPMLRAMPLAELKAIAGPEVVEETKRKIRSMTLDELRIAAGRAPRDASGARAAAPVLDVAGPAEQAPEHKP